MEVLPIGDLMVLEGLAALLMVLAILVFLGDLVAFLLMDLEGLVALHLVVPVDLEVYHLLEAPEGLVVRLLVVLVVLVLPVVLVVLVALVVLLLEASVVLEVLIPEIDPLQVDLPVVLRHNNLFISPLMVLLVIICHINITYLSMQLWTCLICPS